MVGVDYPRVPSSLPVELNRGRLHRIEVDDEATVSGSFAVGLNNHGEAVHVHLNLDDTLARVARLEANNHYVESEARRAVTVDVAEIDEPVTGRLKIVTGYGTETKYVTLTVRPSEEDPGVVVDETLNRAPTTDDEPGTVSAIRRTVERDLTLPVVGFGVLAIGIALAFGVAINTPPVLLGAGVVIGVVLSAIVYLVR